MPRVSRVWENLWVGGAAALASEVDGNADMLVLCAVEYQPDASEFPNVTVVHAPMEDDEPTEQELATALTASKTVADALQAGQRVWVTCLAGMNRSAFVAALALRQLGWTPEDAIRALRDARGPCALSNMWFEDIVLDLALEDHTK